MAFLSLYLNSIPLSPFPSNSHLLPTYFHSNRNLSGRQFVAFSTHSNPRILKSNKRLPYGKLFFPYSDEEEEEEVGEDELKGSKSEFSESSQDEHAEMKEFDMYFSGDQKKSSFQTKNDTTQQGNWRVPKGGREETLKSGRNLQLKYNSLQVKRSKDIPERRKKGNVTHSAARVEERGFVNGGGKIKNGNSAESRFRQLSEDLGFDEKWFPLIDYLSTFGLKESHFIQISERHMPCLQLNVASAQERLEYLLSVGVKHRDIKKILLRQPQILEYTVENNLKSHVAFLVSLGVPDSRIGHIITAAPSLFSYSVEHSLKPTIRYLVEEVGIKGSEVSKVVQLSPQILVQRIDNSWTSRFCFLSKELGAPKDSIVKMVTKHPQVLHYSIEDGILPRINFLRSIGMHNSDILKVLTSLTQVLSLSLEGNLKPKYLYLVNELRNEVKSLTKYPTYLSLSLEQRIRPRHRFLVSLKKVPKGPFPLSSFVPTDECFCHQWAGTSLEKYLAFRQTFLLSDFAKKYERKKIIEPHLSS
ncbi:transcription termination factor MTERF9, chloroplastic isoform X1 [Cinnamomum micranthum f. kanehirae]|uniref:Transcription termination factor MTERF9, chloroplastic isoform X1 n=1 Tax=Cinnamomum micranthum f. kanehirae TaxID=337451 RepID=A0A3S3Q0Q9_9MAGN|nr:transcription termination factor MTERF9, chloroplastic isoform X1 [Cinnamomum micranthum f. kanehirae]